MSFGNDVTKDLTKYIQCVEQKNLKMSLVLRLSLV